MHRTALLMLALALALAAAAPSAHGATAVFAAYGEGLTYCKITISKSHDEGFTTGGVGKTDFYGRTECSVPVAQTGQATVPADANDPSLSGAFCSGTVATCFSGANVREVSNSSAMTYTLSLRAPLGQGWVGAPTNCSGVGTDNLRCAFSINGVGWLGL
jgi:hypothetical protein